MKKIIVFAIIAFAFLSARSQGLYMPRDIKAAYKNETRSMDGKPGKNYWQNRGIYNISITATPPDRTIRGKETITYFNNSPDTLRNPVIKLFLNIHKPGAPRNGGVSADYLNSGVHIDAVTADGKKVNWPNNPFAFTAQQFRLPASLPPHGSVQLTFDWHYEISLESYREGMIDSTTYFLAFF